jgi:hypothetical protein
VVAAVVVVVVVVVVVSVRMDKHALSWRDTRSCAPRCFESNCSFQRATSYRTLNT